jgi:hypothetical protein
VQRFPRNFKWTTCRGIPVAELCTIQSSYLEGVAIHRSAFMRMTTACGVVLHIMCQTGGCVLDYSHFGDEAEICCCQPHVFVVSECSLDSEGY